MQYTLYKTDQAYTRGQVPQLSGHESQPKHFPETLLEDSAETGHSEIMELAKKMCSEGY